MLKLWYWFLLFFIPSLSALIIWLGVYRGIAVGQNIIFRREKDPSRFWFAFIGSLIGVVIMIAICVLMVADCAAPGFLSVSIGDCRLW